MPALQIDPSELYPSQPSALPPPPGASVLEWAAFRGSAPRLMPPAVAAPAKRVKNRCLRAESRQRRPTTKVTPELVDKVAALAKRCSDPEIAAALDLSKTKIFDIRADYGIPPFVPRLRAGTIAVKTPDWVPAEYAAEFRRRVKARGTERAIKWVRCRMAGIPPSGRPRGKPLPPELQIKIRASKLIKSVARKHGVLISGIRGPHREPRIAVARFELYYRLRLELRWAMTEIAAFVCRRDHSTVVHGIAQHCRRHNLRPPVGPKPGRRPGTRSA